MLVRPYIAIILNVQLGGTQSPTRDRKYPEDGKQSWLVPLPLALEFEELVPIVEGCRVE